MKLKQLILAGALTIATGLANAAIFNVTPDPMVAGSVYNNNAFVNGQFEDRYNFTLASPLTSLWATISIESDSQAGVILNIDTLAADLFDSSNTLLSNDALIGGLNLSAGDYYFLVSGQGNGAMGGNYNFTLATVPEPETLALMLLGAGLMALGMRRR